MVAAYPSGSKAISAALEMKLCFIEAVKAEGVEIVLSMEELLTKLDVVLLESVDGRTHYRQASPVLCAGKTMIIDKPIAATLEDAERIFKAANNIAGTAFGEKGSAPSGPFSTYDPLINQIIIFF